MCANCVWQVCIKVASGAAADGGEQTPQLYIAGTELKLTTTLHDARGIISNYVQRLQSDEVALASLSTDEAVALSVLAEQVWVFVQKVCPVAVLLLHTSHPAEVYELY